MVHVEFVDNLLEDKSFLTTYDAEGTATTDETGMKNVIKMKKRDMINKLLGWSLS